MLRTGSVRPSWNLVPSADQERALECKSSL